MKNFLLVALLAFSFNANAALVGRLADTNGAFQAYYDTDADLTWLADANGGQGNWSAANTWASNLNIDGVTGWRLPDTLQPDASCSGQNSGQSSGSGCSGSEMGNLFYNTLGNTPGYGGGWTSPPKNYGPFTNVVGANYWSATEYVPSPTSSWVFNMGDGTQAIGSKSYQTGLYRWAVQSGDISAVPIPAAVWLFGSGILGLVAVARRKTIS